MSTKAVVLRQSVTFIGGEIWLPVVGFEETYSVSNMGRVMRLSRGQRTRPFRVLKGFENPRTGGHTRVQLHYNGKPFRRLIHRLVLEAFVGPCPEGMEACHNNDIAWDNRLENLRWDTPVANAKDRIRNGHDYHLNKTHCPQGHSYSGSNLHVKKDGTRKCRTCNRIRQRKYLERVRPKSDQSSYSSWLETSVWGGHMKRALEYVTLDTLHDADHPEFVDVANKAYAVLTLAASQLYAFDLAKTQYSSHGGR